MSDKEEDYFQILNIPYTASQRAVRAAYIRLALAVHPDKNNTGKHHAFVKIIKAYETLYDDKSRVRYLDENEHVKARVLAAKKEQDPHQYEPYIHNSSDEREEPQPERAKLIKAKKAPKLKPSMLVGYVDADGQPTDTKDGFWRKIFKRRK